MKNIFKIVLFCFLTAPYTAQAKILKCAVQFQIADEYYGTFLSKANFILNSDQILESKADFWTEMIGKGENRSEYYASSFSIEPTYQKIMIEDKSLNVLLFKSAPHLSNFSVTTFAVPYPLNFDSKGNLVLYAPGINYPLANAKKGFSVSCTEE